MHQNTNQYQNNNLHEPVLLTEVLQYLAPQKGDSYLDVTAGYGGHAREVLERTQAPDKCVLVDRDQNAIDELQKRFAGQAVTFKQQDFYTVSSELNESGRQFNVILADLGVSSPHLNETDRGFSISQNGPLDMRMDRSQGITAETVVNTYSEKDLAKLLKVYGEEPKAAAIAGMIVAARPFHDTASLAAIVSRAWPGHSRIHPATRTFQALRIVVNDELSLLEMSLPLWLKLLAPEGRIAIISFHSLEDRIVKKAFADVSSSPNQVRYDAEFRLLTKKPVTASQTELVFNPRSRSAKLRAAAKINN
jgi:16S rRNA (cytosine1402-N4)-methyltransferase